MRVSLAPQTAKLALGGGAGLRTLEKGTRIMKKTAAQMPRLITAVIDGKGLGNTINALAALGLIEPVYARVGDTVLGFNSTWALTDWKREQGYYGVRAAQLDRCEVVTRVG